MITSEEIAAIARRYQTTELNALREYCQHLFLSYFYREKEAAGIFFKGGTALRIIYGSPRFSEDLDFSAANRRQAGPETLVLTALAEIEREAVKAEIEESKLTSGGYLAVLIFFAAGRAIPIKLEISFRKKQLKGELVTVAGDFIPPYTLTQLAREELAGEKLKALLSRAKPRDFYDLYFLLRANLLSAGQKKIIREAAEVLDRSEINFSRELKEFLPVAMHPVIKNFKMTLARELRRYL